MSVKTVHVVYKKIREGLNELCDYCGKKAKYIAINEEEKEMSYVCPACKKNKEAVK